MTRFPPALWNMPTVKFGATTRPVILTIAVAVVVGSALAFGAVRRVSGVAQGGPAPGLCCSATHDVAPDKQCRVDTRHHAAFVGKIHEYHELQRAVVEATLGVRARHILTLELAPAKQRSDCSLLIPLPFAPELTPTTTCSTPLVLCYPQIGCA